MCSCRSRSFCSPGRILSWIFSQLLRLNVVSISQTTRHFLSTCLTTTPPDQLLSAEVRPPEMRYNMTSPSCAQLSAIMMPANPFWIQLWFIRSGQLGGSRRKGGYLFVSSLSPRFERLFNYSVLRRGRNVHVRYLREKKPRTGAILKDEEPEPEPSRSSPPGSSARPSDFSDTELNALKAPLDSDFGVNNDIPKTVERKCGSRLQIDHVGGREHYGSC